jgi:hypothetical protein
LINSLRSHSASIPFFRKKNVTPGTLGKVEYRDEPLGTALGALEREGASGLFRKRNKYAFEAEWRSIRLLKALEKFPGEVYLSGFDPRACERLSSAMNAQQRRKYGGSSQKT